LFDNRLRKPEIAQGSRRKTWGFCQWEDRLQDTGSYTTIKLMDKWFTPSWFVQTLAHEMVHQYQWDIERLDNTGFNIRENSGAHGPSFFAWRDRFAYWGINLKTAHGQRRWFRHQDFNKC
jgi:hypothetical protein